MRRSIKLDCNIAIRAEKIDNVPTYAVLPAKFLPEDLTTLEVSPKNLFRWCGIVSQLFPMPAEWRQVDETAFSFSHQERARARMGPSRPPPPRRLLEVALHLLVRRGDPSSKEGSEAP